MHSLSSKTVFNGAFSCICVLGLIVFLKIRDKSTCMHHDCSSAVSSYFSFLLKLKSDVLVIQRWCGITLGVPQRGCYRRGGRRSRRKIHGGRGGVGRRSRFINIWRGRKAWEEGG